MSDCSTISFTFCVCGGAGLDVQWLWHISVAPLRGSLLLFFCTPQYTVCVCVCVCHRKRQTQRVVSRRTGRLVICLSAFRLPKHCLFFDYTVYLQVWITERVGLPLSASACALPEHVEGVTCSSPCSPSLSVCSPGGCHGNSQTAADFAAASWGDCENREEVSGISLGLLF